MPYHSSSDDSSAPFFESSRCSSSEEEDDSSDDEIDREWFDYMLRQIQENDPVMTDFSVRAEYEEIRNMSDEDWEELGRNISNNSHLKTADLAGGTLNDHKMSFFFRGLIRSASIKDMKLYDNGFGVEGVRSMVSFLRNANNLVWLDLDNNSIRSEGFNVLFRALRDSPIETLLCENCGIESIEIGSNDIPENLKLLRLSRNNINTDGCREVAKLLQRADSTLAALQLEDNQIDDEGVAILVDALQSNTSLIMLDLGKNEEISIEGMKMLLKLVDDVSSIKATLHSNHTLSYITVKDEEINNVTEQIREQIDVATMINRNCDIIPGAAGRDKVIRTQLHSGTREMLANLLGVERSVYSEINPLHLPEVLALVGRRHGQGELYVALKSSIAEVISTVNRKECIQQQMAYYAARLEELGAELATIESSEGHVVEVGESRSNKRRRKWWWGLWGGA